MDNKLEIQKLNRLSADELAKAFRRDNNSRLPFTETFYLKRNVDSHLNKKSSGKSERIFKSFCREWDGPSVDLDKIHKNFLHEIFGFNL